MKKADVGQFKVYNLQRQFMAFLETAGLREEQVPGRARRGRLLQPRQVQPGDLGLREHPLPLEAGREVRVLCRLPASTTPSTPIRRAGRTAATSTPDAVRIMTVHQAKGLQWPVVFIPQLVRNRFPRKGGGGRTPWHLLPAEAFDNAQRYKGGVEDERRLVLRGGDPRAEVPAHDLGADAGQQARRRRRRTSSTRCWRRST